MKMSVNNIKHGIYKGLGRIGIPLLILVLFTWGLPRTAQAQHYGHHFGHGGFGHGGFGYGGYGHGGYGYGGYGYGYGTYGYGSTPALLLDEVTRVARLAGLGALDLNNIKPKKTGVFLNGQYIGVAGDFDGYPAYLWLKKGTHQLVFYKDGYRTLAREYTIHPGVVIDASSVQPGTQVVVKLNKGMGKKVNGSFVASNADGITVLAEDSEELTVPWYKVRDLTAKHEEKLQLEPGESVPPQEFAAKSAERPGVQG